MRLLALVVAFENFLRQGWDINARIAFTYDMTAHQKGSLQSLMQRIQCAVQINKVASASFSHRRRRLPKNLYVSPQAITSQQHT